MRQALTAHFRLRRQKRPAILNQLLIGLWKAIWRFHTGIVTANTALFVANCIEWEQDFLGELAPLIQDRIHKVRRSLLEAGKV